MLRVASSSRTPLLLVRTGAALSTKAHGAASATTTASRKSGAEKAGQKQEQNDDDDVWDAIIVGGGVPGSLVAARLAGEDAAAGRRIAVIEPMPPKKATADQLRSMDPDPRVFSITPASIAALQAANVWTAVENIRVAPFRGMQVWDTVGPGHVRFSSGALNAPYLGVVAENRVLQHVLYTRVQELQDQGKCNLIEGEKVKLVKPGSDAGDLATVQLEGGRTMKAQLVVGADGAQSSVRTMAGVGTIGWQYEQVAVIATVKADATTDVAWQRFLPSGPLAFLPLWDSMISVVWSTTPQHAEQLKSMSAGEFVAALNDAMTAAASPPEVPTVLRPFASIGQRVQEAVARAGSDQFTLPPAATEVVGPRLSFPLQLAHATSYYKPRIALIGDAAHRMHPLAGQGLNLGIGDADTLATALVAAVQVGGDLGSTPLLEAYSKARVAANVPMLASMDLAKLTFACEIGPLPHARNLGMTLLNAAAPFKTLVAKFAMGRQA